MAESPEQTGVLLVQGTWATRLTYEAHVMGPKAGLVDVGFAQGRSEFARVTLESRELPAVIGQKNSESIARHVASDADKYLATVQGELRGDRLHYRDVILPGTDVAYGNSIGMGRMPDADLSARPATPNSSNARPDSPSPESEASEFEQKPFEQPSGPDTRRRRSVPAHIAAKYLVKDARYHFDDQTVAFIDHGSRLTAKTHNSAVIKDLVDIAKARDWHEVHVTGTPSFKREAWREAYAAGLTVSGYVPSELELLAANRSRERRGEANGRSSGETEQSTARGAPRAASAPDATTAAERAASPPGNAEKILYGTLIAHGPAPYQHNPAKGANYYVTLQSDRGTERTHWGVGLEEAIRTARTAPSVGDRVGIQKTGSRPVTVDSRAPGPDGQPIRQPVAAKRHLWIVEKEEFFKGKANALPAAQSSESSPSRAAMSGTTAGAAPSPEPTKARDQEVATAIRSAETTREELQLKYPDINRAVFKHLSSHEQFADAYVKAGLIREADRAQVIAQMRERLASQVERGKVIREPDDQQVDTLIRRSVNRVAADIGRPAVAVRAPQEEVPETPKPALRDEAQVRA